MRETQKRKLVSGRIPVPEWALLRDYAAFRGLTQDELVARWVRKELKKLKFPRRATTH